jgi:hypothetical protein
MSRTPNLHARPETVAPQALASRPALTRRRAMVLGALFLLFALSVLCPASARAITRPIVLARAQSWVDKPVAYSQAKYHLGYRTDCSGYVSMCWQTGMSWSTSSFHAVTHSIKVSELKPGDAMLRKGYHIRLFHNWANSSHTSYVAYEAGTKVAVARVHSLSTDLKSGYIPTRYNEILDGPLADNVLWNSSFDAWSGSWGAGGEQPVMWNVDGPEWETLVAHRTDVVRTGHDSLQLLAPGDKADTPTEVSQAASVTAGATYRLCAWARTAGDPEALRLSVEFLDAAGASLGETSATGAQFGINDAGFRAITALTTAPAGAVNAVVMVQLAAPPADAAGPASAIIDDVSLVRPRVSVSIKTSASTVRRGRKVTLNGSVSPSSAASVTATVYVKRPGRGWKRLAAVRITAAGSGASWRASYAFKRGVRKGLYRFRTSVPALPGYLGQTSRTVGVKLK